MKKLLVVAVVAVAALIVMMTGSEVMAAENTLTVNGTVIGTCKFNTPTSTLSFILDPSLATDATATTNPAFWCTRGASYAAVTDNGVNFVGTQKKMKSAGTPAELINYSVALSPASGTGSGKGTPISLVVTGTVLNADYINAMALNDYTDTVVITITP